MSQLESDLDRRPAAVLILDCTACQDPRLAGLSTRQQDGLREWTAPFDYDAENRLEARDKADLLCPECGAPGRIWAY